MPEFFKTPNPLNIDGVELEGKAIATSNHTGDQIVFQSRPGSRHQVDRVILETATNNFTEPTDELTWITSWDPEPTAQFFDPKKPFDQQDE